MKKLFKDKNSRISTICIDINIGIITLDINGEIWQPSIAYYNELVRKFKPELELISPKKIIK